MKGRSLLGGAIFWEWLSLLGDEERRSFLGDVGMAITFG
ncbi:hypothetical protein O53_2768 [Microcystis aeruginosa TAIHU98]|uniref:Uncharacterized protein n=1 Tax=Microcystis aeruginosa TAIHU98 TaxID=1134457 RepID=L7E6N2_MICAE|nr:hypothetical protein O53_2768 [Microcystis aeruginosa TAIHU98]ODV39752.1 hypothetical protein BFG60_0783 [Microcystis aeruginosa NIES-98]